MTVERARSLLNAEIDRRTNLLNRDRDDDANEATLNVHRIEIQCLNQFLKNSAIHNFF